MIGLLICQGDLSHERLVASIDLFDGGILRKDTPQISR